MVKKHGFTNQNNIKKSSPFFHFYIVKSITIFFKIFWKLESLILQLLNEIILS